MKRLLTIAALGLATALAMPLAYAGTVYRLNDEEIDGEILDVTTDYVVIKVGGGRQSIPLREVRDIEFNAGESLWQKKVKEALQRTKDLKKRELEQKKKLAEINQKPMTVPLAQAQQPSSAGPVVVAPAPHSPIVSVGARIPRATDKARMDAQRLGNIFPGDRYRFVLRYPSAFTPDEPDSGYIRFRDEQGAIPWTFNVTYFDSEEAEYDVIRVRAENELKRIPNYTRRSQTLFDFGRQVTGERTTGHYERAGRAIRHDQLIVPTRGGVLLIHFFSPGATMEDNAVPEVDAVVASLELQ